ncbi:MAG: hypothetical protein AAF401_05475 [Pseudomonadota bacterium]
MKTLAAFLIAVAVPTLAMAYVGPGAGISAIGSLIALIAAVLLAIVGFLWFPLKRMLRKRSNKPAEGSPETREPGE